MTLQSVTRTSVVHHRWPRIMVSPSVSALAQVTNHYKTCLQTFSAQAFQGANTFGRISDYFWNIVSNKREKSEHEIGTKTETERTTSTSVHDERKDKLTEHFSSDTSKTKTSKTSDGDIVSSEDRVSIQGHHASLGTEVQEQFQDKPVLTIDPSQAERFEKMRKNLMSYNSSFLEQYNKDLTQMVKKSSRPAKTVKVQAKSLIEAAKEKPADNVQKFDAVTSKRKRSWKKSDAIQKFLLYNKGSAEPNITPEFESCRTFLVSHGITTFELEYYPDIQVMTNNEILDCVQRLKEDGILCIYSLFLIQRMFMQIKEERETGKLCLKPKLKFSHTRVACLRNVKKYLSLCRLLETPDLDPVALLEQWEKDKVLGKTLLLKNIEVLRSVGATGKQIMENTSILKYAQEKVEIYKEQSELATFNLKLFKTSTITEFKSLIFTEAEHLKMKEVAEQLDVSVQEFQSYWGSCLSKSASITYILPKKVELCLNAGFSQQEILMHLRELDRMSLEELYRQIREQSSNDFPRSINLIVQQNKASESVLGKRTTRRKSSTLSSSKRRRSTLFKVISLNLQLDQAGMGMLFACNLNVDDTLVMDVLKNLALLKKWGFSKEELARCPMVMAHPNTRLSQVLESLEQRVLGCLNATNSLCREPSGYASHHGADKAPQVVRAPSEFSEKANRELCDQLMSDRVSQLQMLQYLLEREDNFSRGNNDHRIKNVM